MNNKIRYTLLSLCLGFGALAQTTIAQAEYFWDTDPGQGSGSPFLATDGSFNASIESFGQSQIPLPSTGGLHTFNVRVKSSDGVWSPVHKQVVALPATAAVPVIAEAEYFWNTDPGQGNGTTFSSADGTFNATIENIEQSAIALPAQNGLHKLCVRLKDSFGVWGPIHTQVVYRDNALLSSAAVATIADAEYFWDNDPGQGGGTYFPAEDQNFNASVEKLLQSGIPIAQPVGLHVFNARVKDNFGVWGPVHKQVIYIETTLASEQFEAAKLVIWPNPLHDVLNVGSTEEITSVQVFNVLGQQVISREVGANNGQIDVSGLRQGTYVVKVTSAQKTKTIKVVKE